MYTISMSGTPYGQSPGAAYTGELYRTDVPTLRGAVRIGRKALCTMDQVAHIYQVTPGPGTVRCLLEVDRVTLA